MATTTTQPLHKPIHYDSVRRRLWIFGQRCHHGATGALLTFAGAVGVARTHTMVAFEAFSRHDLEKMFSIGAEPAL